NARLRSQLAEARAAKDWLAKNVDEALKAIHAAPPEIAPLATPFAPGDLPRAVAGLAAELTARGEALSKRTQEALRLRSQLAEARQAAEIRKREYDHLHGLWEQAA